jgi:hypothetical protein
MGDRVMTNVRVYREVVEESYAAMRETMSRQCRPKPNGEPGCIKIYDPKHTSVKQAMICIVFAGMWLEAELHILLGWRCGKDVANDADRKSWEEKLRILGVVDEELLKKVGEFRRSRKDLVHEKAFFSQDFVSTAQDNAELAYHVVRLVEAVLKTRDQRPAGLVFGRGRGGVEGGDGAGLEGDGGVGGLGFTFADNAVRV